METSFYEMYLEEVGQVLPFEAGEEEALLRQLAEGSAEARTRLVEGNLRRVLALAGEYEKRELPMSDVVQEANAALMLAAVEYDGSQDWTELLESRVRDAIELALKEQQTENSIEENMAARVNVLQTVSRVMAQELGREATVEELATKMKMTEDEIKDIMKLALDALTVNGEGQAAEPDEGEAANRNSWDARRTEPDEGNWGEPRPGMSGRPGAGQSGASQFGAGRNPMRDGWSLDDEC